MQQVGGGGYTVGADTDVVALNGVLLSAVIKLDTVAVEANYVPRPGDGAADGVKVAAGDLDAEEVVALGRARGGGNFGAIADAALAIGPHADEVALDGVAGRGRGQRANDMDPD